MLIGLSASRLSGLLVGVCRLGMWNAYLFECCLVFRLHWDGLVGMWLCSTFLVSSFWPRRVEGTVYFFFVVIFWTPAWIAKCLCFVVCGGLFFCWVSGFSRPVSDFVLKFFCGEFDPGSGRTLAACLTHASRTERPAACCGYSSGERVSNTWVICLALRDKLGKLGLIPDRTAV